MASHFNKWLGSFLPINSSIISSIIVEIQLAGEIDINEIFSKQFT